MFRLNSLLCSSLQVFLFVLFTVACQHAEVDDKATILQTESGITGSAEAGSIPSIPSVSKPSPPSRASSTREVKSDREITLPNEMSPGIASSTEIPPVTVQEPSARRSKLWWVLAVAILGSILWGLRQRQRHRTRSLDAPQS